MNVEKCLQSRTYFLKNKVYVTNRCYFAAMSRSSPAKVGLLQCTGNPKKIVNSIYTACQTFKTILCTKLYCFLSPWV